MTQWKPDSSFYPSPELAITAPPEKHAFVAVINPTRQGKPDRLDVVDVDTQSSSYGRIVASLNMPEVGDELHHFGWNACSSCLCPNSPHPHMERRYLVVPGLRSSRVHVVDVKPDPRNPRLVKVHSAESIKRTTGYSRPHTTHCGPDGIYVSALGSTIDGEGPGGIFTMAPEDFELHGPWEVDRGPQNLAYDFWWHLNHDTLISSEWGTPKMVEDGLNADILMSAGYGHAIHVWDLNKRKHRKVLDLGSENQMVLELRPAHDPRRTYGFVGVVTSLANLSSSVWVWHLDSGQWNIRKILEIPAEPAAPEQLPDILKAFKATPPLVTDINLSVDDRYLYVSCWGTGQLLQYDVSDPFHPKLKSSVRIGGIVGRTAHPSVKEKPLNGGPQMVEVSRDGKRVYLTNSLYAAWDEQFYPDGIRGWMVKLDVDPDNGMHLDPDFFVEFDDGMRPHQVRLEGGDASSDSYCYSGS